MKAVLIGCGVIAGLVVIVFLGVGYFGVKIVKDMGEEVGTVRETFGELNTAFPFQEPADGLVDRKMYDTWLAVRESMAESVAAYDTIMQNFSMKSLSGLKQHTFDMMGKIGAELNVYQMSPAEYIWISQHIAGALQSGDLRAKPELQALIAEFDGLGKRNHRGGANGDPGDLAVPVTSKQIQRIGRLISRDPGSFIKCIKAFYIDMAILGLLHDMPEPEENHALEAAKIQCDQAA